MPVLGICGDSWFAATLNIDRDDCRDSEGKHFSELLSKKLNYDLFTLARGACSNSAIRLQMSEMVKKKVDFIIVGVTSANRIEYPRYDDKVFDPESGIYNIYYTHCPDNSSKYFDKNQEVLISDTLTNIFGNKFNSAPVRSEEQRDAIKSYYLEMFDINFREQQDAWIIASGIQEIRDAGIPYLLLGLPFLKHTTYFKDTNRDILCDGNRGIVPCVYGVSGVRRWHTTDDVQIQLANNLYDYITKNNLL
jgi:hypothetical protein